jgi:hypothetical protein
LIKVVGFTAIGALAVQATLFAATRLQTVMPARVDPITATETTTSTSTSSATTADPVSVPRRPQVISPYR